MDNLQFMNEVNNILRVEGRPKGPLARWEKKQLETSDKSLALSMQKISVSGISNSSEEKRSARKSPGRKLGRSRSTPSPARDRKPGSTTKADRFVPSRSHSNFDLCHHLMKSEPQNQDDDDNPSQESQAALQRVIAETVNGVPTAGQPQRLLQYNIKPPAAPEGHQNPLRTVYSQSKVPSSVKTSARYIPQAPDRILDAPEIIDDYYLNLLDWSANNILAVALGNSVYLWNAGTGQIDQLMSLEGSEQICSLAWIQGGGSHLAIGITNGTTELWDCENIKKLRVMEGHAGRVGSLAWNLYVLSSGSRLGTIVHHDVRQREHLISTLNGHTQEVCGLKWSPDGKYLASGGNDNLLNIWAAVNNEKHSQTTPLYSFNDHMAAVKGLAWCPWNPSILASGGGTADRTIKIWNVNNGTNLQSVDTKSQVCSILWSQNFKELISGHGYANNQLIIWKYPLMTKVAELTGHTARVLHLAMSPDGTTVLSAGADETLRLWKCFVPDPSKKKEPEKMKSAKSIFKQSIR